MQNKKSQIVEDIYPLTPLQQGMLFHTLMTPDSGVYIEQLHGTLETSLNLSAFEQSLQILVDRHTALRSVFTWKTVDIP